MGNLMGLQNLQQKVTGNSPQNANPEGGRQDNTIFDNPKITNGRFGQFALGIEE